MSKIAIIITSIIATLLIIAGAGGTYYYYQKSQKTAQAVNEPEKTPAVKECDEDEWPVVSFQPAGLFTEAEKTEIKNKIINPFYDWSKEGTEKIDYLTITVEELDAPKSGYSYSANAVARNNAYTGWLFGENKQVKWWTPDCMDACTFSDSFKQKYPEVVAAYNGN